MGVSTGRSVPPESKSKGKSKSKSHTNIEKMSSRSTTATSSRRRSQCDPPRHDKPQETATVQVVRFQQRPQMGPPTEAARTGRAAAIAAVE